MGRHTEAVAQVEKALLRSSPSFISEQFAAWVYLGAGRYDKTIQLVKEIVARLPSDSQAPRRAELVLGFLVPAYRGNGEYGTAIELERQNELLFAKDPDTVNAHYRALSLAFEADGPKGHWREKLERQKPKEENPLQLAILYARDGQSTTALRYLGLAAQKMPLELCFVLNREPGFDTLRSNPGFKKILEFFGLPR